MASLSPFLCLSLYVSLSRLQWKLKLYGVSVFAQSLKWRTDDKWLWHFTNNFSLISQKSGTVLSRISFWAKLSLFFHMFTYLTTMSTFFNFLPQHRYLFKVPDIGDESWMRVKVISDWHSASISAGNHCRYVIREGSVPLSWGNGTTSPLHILTGPSGLWPKASVHPSLICQILSLSFLPSFLSLWSAYCRNSNYWWISHLPLTLQLFLSVSSPTGVPVSFFLYSCPSLLPLPYRCSSTGVRLARSALRNTPSRGIRRNASNTVHWATTKLLREWAPVTSRSAYLAKVTSQWSCVRWRRLIKKISEVMK